MLNLALSTIKDTIQNITVSDQPLIQNYGGLVIPFPEKVQVSKTAKGQPIFKEKLYPVSCGVSFEACMASRRYQQLIPNSNYRSLAYWEQDGDAVPDKTPKKYDPKGNLLTLNIPCRLVCWFNIPRMNLNSGGGQECTIAAPLMVKICDVLHNNGRKWTVPDPAYKKAWVRLEFKGQEKKDVKKIFGKWDYGNKVNAFLLYPYDWFSLRYNVQITINKKCVSAFSIGEPVSC